MFIKGEVMDYMVLVNKDNLFELSVFSSLVLYGYDLDGNEILLERQTAKMIRRLLEKLNSIKCFRKVVVDSGYRSFSQQAEVYDYYKNRLGEESAGRRVAAIGTSEHHTGLAVDVSLVIDGKCTDECTGEEPEMVWLRDNCYKYGFILRYPKGKENITGFVYEPWHFRYVGSIQKALDIKKSNLTFDEYVSKIFV